MSVKKGLAGKIVCFSLLAMSVVGCKNDDSSGNVNHSSDARVLSFVLADNAAVAPSLASYVFAIEQKSSPSVIENNDSLPVGTNIDRNLLATITFNGASDAKVVYKDGSRETKSYVSTDSINFANYNVQLEVTAGDGTTKKYYDLKVNVHKEDPEAMSWRQVSGLSAPMKEQVSFDEGEARGFVSFYKEGTTLRKYNYSTGTTASIALDAQLSTILHVKEMERYAMLDMAGQLWIMNSVGNVLAKTQVNVDKLFGYVIAVDWSLPSGPIDAVYLIYSSEGILHALNPESGKHIKRYFPQGGRLDEIDSFVRVNNAEGSIYNHLIIVGNIPGESRSRVYEFGLWDAEAETETEDRKELDCIAYNGQSNRNLPALKSPAFFEYRGLLFVVGGEKSDGTLTKDVYVSRDLGINWEKQTKKLAMDNIEGLTARRGVSAQVRDGKHIYFLGGETAPSVYTPEVWKGKINKVDHR